MCDKIDVREYNDSELSDIFINDECLYNTLLRSARLNNWVEVKTVAEELFIFTADQLDELEVTFEEYKEEAA